MYYELRGVEELPTIELKLSLKMVLLAKYPTLLRRFNTVVHATKRILIRTTYLFSLLQVIGMIVPAQVGEILILPTILSCIHLCFGILAMRYDMIHLVMKTYDFWYITIISIIYCIVGTIQIQNGRWVAIFTTSWTSISFIMIDANYKSGREIIGIGLMYATTQFVGILLVSFHVIDQFGSFVIIQHNEWVLMSDDVLINCLGVLMVMTLRSSYRRYQHYRMATDGKNTVRCITYRARVEFVESRKSILQSRSKSTVQSRKKSRMNRLGSQESWKAIRKESIVIPVIQSLGDIAKGELGPTQAKVSNKTQLMIEPPMGLIDPQDMIMKRFTSIDPYPTRVRQFCQGLIIIGVTTSLVSLFCLELKMSEIENIWPFTLAFVSFILSILVYGVSHLHRHHGIVRKLLTSFDFMFLNFQVISATITLIFLFRGDTRSIIVIPSLFWILWIMTLDSLTPVIRAKFGITPHLIMYVMLIVTISQFYLVLRVGSHVHDRIIFQWVLKNDRVVQWRAIGFYFTRMFTICAWCLRLLYRVKGLLDPAHSNALIMVYGPVEYEDAAWMRTRTIVPQGFRSVRIHTIDIAFPKSKGQESKPAVI